MEEVKFEKIEGSKYILVNGKDQIDSKVADIIQSISGKEANLFNSTVTDVLYETILSRLVAGLFITHHRESVGISHHIVITAGINNKTYNITIGALQKEDSLGYINGIVEI